MINFCDFDFLRHGDKTLKSCFNFLKFYFFPHFNMSLSLP